MLFCDRRDAGQKLAKALASYAKDPDALLIALPRGGVVVAHEIAKALDLPLDIVSPRKIGHPTNPEYAIGAITESGEGVISEEYRDNPHIEKIIEREKREAQKRLALYRKDRPPRDLKGKKVILIDDGLATGSTMRAAIQTVRAELAKRVVIALPVAPPEALASIELLVDETICLLQPPVFYAVSLFYEHFEEVSDQEVIACLLT